MRINLYESCSCFSIIKTKTISEKDINGRVNYFEIMINSKNLSPAPSCSRLTARELSLSVVKRRRLFSTERKNVKEQNKVIQQRQWPRHLGVILNSAIVILFSNNESIKREKCKPTSFRSHPRYQQRFSLKFSTISNINIHNKQQHHGINDE